MQSKIQFIVVSTLVVCGVLAFIEHGLQINYIIKTGLKITLFFLNIWLYILVFKDFKFKDALKINKMKKKAWLRLLLLGACSEIVVLVAYVSLQPFLISPKYKKILQIVSG